MMHKQCHAKNINVSKKPEIIRMQFKFIFLYLLPHHSLSSVKPTIPAEFLIQAILSNNFNYPSQVHLQ